MTQPSPHRAQAGFLPPQKMVAPRAFSLVEVALALGLVAFVMTALFGLLATGLNSSRESSLETAFAQIAQHASSSYQPTVSPTTWYYDYNGTLTTGSNGVTALTASTFFTVAIQDTPSASSIIPDTSSNLHLLTLSITGADKVTKTIQTSVFVPDP